MLLAWSRDRGTASNSSALLCSCTLSRFLVPDHLCLYIAYDINCGLRSAFPVLLKNLDRLLLPEHKEQQPFNQTVTQ